MKVANVAAAKNDLSRLLKQVQRGETVLITDRNKPIAQLQPIENSDSILANLHAAGVLIPPKSATFDLGSFLKSPRAKLSAGHSLTEAVLSEREEGR